MLYKNDELYKLSPNDLKALEGKFKYPMKIVYPANRIKKNPSPENKLPDKPNSISFPLRSMVTTKTGTDVWRYADNLLIQEHGVKKYLPTNFRFTGKHVLEENDRELAWFLYTKSEFCGNGLNAGPNPKFIFEDKVTEAEKLAERQSNAIDARALIYGKEVGLPEEKLRVIAKAYFVKNVDQLTFAQVKLALEQAISAEGNEGYARFMEVTGSEAYLKLRMRLQNLIDAGKLNYDAGRREWAWMEGGKKIEAICRIAPGDNAKDALIEFYEGNTKFQETVEIVDKPKKVKHEKVKEE